MSLVSRTEQAPPPYTKRPQSVIALPFIPHPAPTEALARSVEDAREASCAQMQTSRKERKRGCCRPCRPKPKTPPVILPSPFQKAPKTKVRNFREGVNEGAKCAWAEVKEGSKAPVTLAWGGLKYGGLLGGVAGLVCGTLQVARASIAATIVFANHSSRGAIRGMRSTDVETSLTPFGHDDAESHSSGNGFATEYKDGPEHLSTATVSMPSPSPSSDPVNVFPAGPAGGSTCHASDKRAEEEVNPVEMDVKWGTIR